jgi:hypothetical protein
LVKHGECYADVIEPSEVVGPNLSSFPKTEQSLYTELWLLLSNQGKAEIVPAPEIERVNFNQLSE